MRRFAFALTIASAIVGIASSALAQSSSVAAGSRGRPLIKLDRTALKLKRDSVRMLYLAGKQQYRFGQFEAALKTFRQVYRQQAEADLLFDIAATYARWGKMRRAFAYHRRYVDRFKKPAARLVAAARFGQVMKEIYKQRSDRAKASASQPVPR